MQLWQWVLILFLAILVGVLGGALPLYAPFRFVFRSVVRLSRTRRAPSPRRPASSSSARPAPTAQVRPGGSVIIERQPRLPPPVADRAETPEVHIDGNQQMRALLAECERNRAKALRFSGSKLVPLETDAWDACPHLVRGLHPGLRNALESVYTDIALLNHLVWLSDEFQRSSPGVRAQYLSLSEKIAARLDGIVRAPVSQFTVKDRNPK